MRKKHNIVLKKPGGGVQIYGMKQWLRDNPEYLPEGIDHSSTSHQMRRAFEDIGWGLKIGNDRVLVIKPTDDGDTSYPYELLGDDSEDNEDEEELEAVDTTFRLERDLQSALRANIRQLEVGLKIIDGGKERVTEAGRIDITAIDNGDNIVIIELKAGKAKPQVIAQILAYMGAVTKTDDKPIRGILVAGDFDKRVVLAARAIPNLELKKYSFQFTFESMS
jgi:hypothetical protein